MFRSADAIPTPGKCGTRNEQVAALFAATSDGWKEEQPSDSQMTLDGSGKFDEADSGQTAASLASIGKLRKFWRFRPGGTAVLGVEYTFQGHLPDFNVDTETSSVQDLSITVNSTGVVTRGIQ